MPTSNIGREKPQPMTVTVVCDVLGEENNGVTIAAMNLIRSLKAKGHTVRVVCPDPTREGEEGFYVVPTRHFGPLDKFFEMNQVVLAKGDSAILSEAIDGANVVHSMLPFTLGKTAAQIAGSKGIPLTAGFHMMSENFTAHLALQDATLLNQMIYRFFAPFYKRCAAIHYPTQYLRDLYEGVIGPTNGYVISNGVNNRFRPISAQKPETFRDCAVILFTGRYSREKSHTLLIDAADLSAHRDRIQLIFAGEGPLKNILMSRAQKLPIAPVFQFFSRDEMLRVLNYADLYVHPAEIEAEGIACLEAIACGLVPIISDSPRCATQAYAPGPQNLFRYDDPADLAAKIDWWLEHPRERAACRKVCLDYAARHFSQERCMDEMEQMLWETVQAAREAQTVSR